VPDIGGRFVSNLEIRDRSQRRYVCGQTDMAVITGACGAYASAHTNHVCGEIKTRLNFDFAGPSGRSHAGIAGSNPSGGMDVSLL